MARTINAGENVRRSDTFFVDPREIETPWELNGRTDTFLPENIARLAVDMKENGQLEPCICRSLPGKRVGMVAGFNRQRAALEIVKTNPEFRLEIKVLDGISDRDAFLINIRENMIRTETSAIDNATNIRKLVNQFGFSKPEAADLYKRSPAWVEEMLKLLTLPEPVKEKIRTGDLAASTGQILAKLSEADAADALAEGLAAVEATEQAEAAAEPDLAPVTLPLTVEDDDLAAAIGQLPRKPAKPAKAPKTLTPAEAKAAKASKRAKVSAAVEKAATKKGVVVPRSASELKKLLARREDEVSRLLLDYLAGTATEDALVDALDRSESPIVSTKGQKPIKPATATGPVKSLGKPA